MRMSSRGRGRVNPISVVGLVMILFGLFSAAFPGRAMASTYEVTQAQDFLFSLTSSQQFVVTADAQRNGIDSHLWLYDGSGELIAANDDYYGLDSYISVALSPGSYRLRTGVCCGDPNAWYGTSYQITVNMEAINEPTTTTSTTTSTTTTTVSPFIGAPMNLIGEITPNGVFLDWEAPNEGNVEPERYAISFRIPPDIGWGVATGNVGDANALNTEITLSFGLFESTGGFGEQYVFDVRADNDTIGVYSGQSTQVTLTVEDPTPPTTTTTSTTTTTTTEPPTTTTSTTTTTEPETTTTEPETTTTTSTTTTTTTTEPPAPPTGTTSTTTTEAPVEQTIPPTPSTTQVPQSTTFPQTTTPTTQPPVTTPVVPEEEQELADQGYDAEEVQQITETASELEDAGYSEEDAISIAQTSLDLQDEGYSEEEALTIAETSLELQDKGYDEETAIAIAETSLALEEKGYDEETALEIAETANEVQDLGFSEEDSVDIAETANELRDKGYDEETSVIIAVESFEIQEQGFDEDDALRAAEANVSPLAGVLGESTVAAPSVGPVTLHIVITPQERRTVIAAGVTVVFGGATISSSSSMSSTSSGPSGRKRN